MLVFKKLYYIKYDGQFYWGGDHRNSNDDE